MGLCKRWTNNTGCVCRFNSAILSVVIYLVSDWPKNIEPITDYIYYSRQDGRVEPTHTARVVGPTFTQLRLLRTMVRAMYDPRNQLRVQFFSKKDLEKEDLQLMDYFY